MSYKVNLEVFEGPLDLLLYLIKKNEVNIYDIPIAEITEQYLEYIDLMQLLDLKLAGEFLVTAATLMQIKSRMLLPQEVEKMHDEEEDADPRAELVRKLLEYKKFKEAAKYLEQLEKLQSNIFRRKISSDSLQDIRDADQLEKQYVEASLFDLISAFSKVLKTIPRKQFLEIVDEGITVEGKVHDLLHLLVDNPVLHFSHLLSRSRSKTESIVFFLAILELIRLKEIIVRQDCSFGEIQIVRDPEHIRVT